MPFVYSSSSTGNQYHYYTDSRANYPDSITLSYTDSVSTIGGDGSETVYIDMDSTMVDSRKLYSDLLCGGSVASHSASSHYLKQIEDLENEISDYRELLKTYHSSISDPKELQEKKTLIKMNNGLMQEHLKLKHAIAEAGFKYNDEKEKLERVY